MQVILMQLVYGITWLVIPNCDLNMTICHPYLFRFDRFISKYFLDDAYDTFDDVMVSCFEIEILKISYRALTCSEFESYKKIRSIIFADVIKICLLEIISLFFLNDLNMTVWQVESELRSKVIFNRIYFLKLEKCMWRVKQGQTDVVLGVSQHSRSLKRLISKSSWEIQKVLRKRLDLLESKWLIWNEDWTFLKSEIFQLSWFGNWSNNGFEKFKLVNGNPK